MPGVVSPAAKKDRKRPCALRRSCLLINYIKTAAFDACVRGCYDFGMDAVIAQQREQIVELCRRYRVRRLELFGSAVGAPFDPQRSDVDFLVEFEPLGEGQHADAYFGLRESLEKLLLRPVDLVMTRAIRNPYFLEAIEHTRTILYAA
jgi:predicted nucleotidyltransferase